MKRHSIAQIGWALALVFALAAAAPAAAQQSAAEGVARITGWPAYLHAEAPLPDAADTLGLVPAVDTLTLRYRYNAAPDAPGPRMAFALAWTPGEAALYEGEQVAYGALPATPQVARIALEADVFVEGREVSSIVVAVDSIALRPAPDTLRFEAVGLSYATVFPGTSAEEARRFFKAGFRLDSLHIADIAFEAGMDRWPGPPIGRPRPRPRRPVYVPEPRDGIWIGGLFDPDFPDVDIGESGGDYAPRGETVGRGSGDDSDRRGRRDGDRESDTDRDGRNGERAGRDGDARGRSENGEDDDEEESLTEEALIAASIVGIVAYGGGAIGYAGTTETPLGLTAGRVYPRGGALLQASINQAVFMSESEQPDRLAVRLLGFYDLFSLPVQPAIGAGVVLTGREATDIAPSLSVGVAGNFGRLVILGGYDVLREEVTFGLAVNFRFWQERDRPPAVAER